MTHTFPILMMAAGIAIGASIRQGANLPERAPTRTTLMKADLPECPGREAVVWISELPPRSRTAVHYHPGRVFGFVLDRTIGHTVVGTNGSSRMLRVGQSWQELPNEVHWGSNAGSQGAKLVAFGIMEKGRPLTVAVK